MKLSYLATVTVSALLLIIGHKIAVDGMPVFQEAAQEIVRARVERVIERVTPGLDFYEFDGFEGFEDFGWFDEYDDFMSMLGDRIIFEAKITRGPRRGQIITAEQSLGSFLMASVLTTSVREVSKGDSVLLINTGVGWFFNGHFRSNKLLVLGILFTICVLLFGGKKGFNTILSLCLTFGAIFAVFIPSILSGKNIYLMAILVCVYTTIMTLSIVIGFNKKSFTAALGCLGGIVITGIITLVMDRVLFLTGIVDENSWHLAHLSVGNPINLRAIVFAGIIIGAMGAIMDVAMSISSALWEIKEKAGALNFKTLFRSGLTIGRDIFGTMANTLILAYIGTSLSVVLLLAVYSNSLLDLLNSEMIVVEILQGLSGIFGILFAMPLTAFFCAIFYLQRDQGRSQEKT